jgi:uncharacterized protein (UPF0210 family)
VRRHSRREFVSGLGAAALLPFLERYEFPGPSHRHAAAPRLFRVRAITAGTALESSGDLGHAERALRILAQAKRRVEDAGYEVQTIRIATNPVLRDTGASERTTALPWLRELDQLVAARGAVLSIGPVLSTVEADPQLTEWAEEVARSTSATSFSIEVASPERGVHRQAIKAAAHVMLALSRIGRGGLANFRFAAAANVPAGTPFFPVAYHAGPDALALGLESPRLVRQALMGASDPSVGERRLREMLDAELAPIAGLMSTFAREERYGYLGIDPSPAPGMDSSIGGAIEAFTTVPFGAPSTLEACAVVTAAIKSLQTTTCGYAGLMLPVLEDPVLARRAAEGRFGLHDLLLFSAVCGTGLDVIPVPGDVSADDLARVIADVATLAVRLRKPLSARLFPMPDKRAGDTVEFDDPLLATSVVLPLS